MSGGLFMKNIIMEHSRVFNIALDERGLAYRFRFFLYTFLRKLRMSISCTRKLLTMNQGKFKIPKYLILLNMIIKIMKQAKIKIPKKIMFLNMIINFTRINVYTMSKNGFPLTQRILWEIYCFVSLSIIFYLFKSLLLH